MKITLVQHEIEDAIRMYVDMVVTVTEGTSVTVDLFSPRGSSEVNATINLVSEAEKKAACKAVVEEEVVTPVTRTRRETPAPAEEPVVQESEQTTSDGPIEEVPQQPAKSLFGNLSRPRNA